MRSSGVFKDDFNEAVESFLGSYDNLREIAMLNLGDLFNEFDYPLDVKENSASPGGSSSSMFPTAAWNPGARGL